jgi:phospholipid N-methyltransferase
MRQNLTERLHFLRAFLAHPSRVGAVLPTSVRAVRDMLDLGDIAGARVVVELGAGTGVYTREILARLSPGARLLALEIDPRLAELLAQQFQDPRLEVICASAENLHEHLVGVKADVVVSGLPFTSLESGLRKRILDQMLAALAPGGVALVLQYSPFIQAELRRRFGSVRRIISPLNVPPAFLFACAVDRSTAAPSSAR